MINKKWVSDRFVNVMIYGVIILSTGFILYKIFLAPDKSTNIGRIDKQINISSSEAIDVFPLIGCSAYRVHGDLYWKNKRENSNKN